MEYQNFKKEINPIETTLSSIARRRKISFNLKSTLTQTKQANQNKQKKPFTDRFSEQKKQNKDLKIYANAKPKFKPKCLTSNVNKTNSKNLKDKIK